MISLAILDIFLGISFRTFLKWSVIKALLLFLVEITVAGGHFSGNVVTRCEYLFVESFKSIFVE